MVQGPSDTILVAIRITLRIRESKVRNPDPPDRRRYVLSEHRFLVLSVFIVSLFLTDQAQNNVFIFHGDVNWTVLADVLEHAAIITLSADCRSNRSACLFHTKF